ncbi:hypothetical protein ABMA57_13085 [Saccharospirillum sp. HFRX-1]|uniref:hypothetical protein n=1 Tax=unclassified Saccharospirillum TaxID=2633430 RepID=UPI003712602E
MNTALLNNSKASVDDAVEHGRSALVRRLKLALATLNVWHRRSESRARLRTELIVMDVHRVEKDAGLTPGTLRREASKPFWKE